MNTPAHLLMGTGLLGRPERRGTFSAALAGSIAPDLSLYLMAGWALFVQNIPPRTVFGEYYYSDAWQAVFAVDNSFILWGLLLGLALWRKATLGVAFAGAGFLHILLDFPLHTHDARQHFWPVTDWVFYSPVSYWDNDAYAGIVGPIEVGLAVLFAGLIVYRFKSILARGIAGFLLLLELGSSGVWRFIF